MTPEELMLFHRLLQKYLLWQSERIRQYLAKPIEEITVRDCQAMYNFSEEGIALETIAEHFGCSVEYVSEQVEKRPWLRPRDRTMPVNLMWLQSDHSDPLELVKLFYPDVLAEHISRETCAEEAPSEGYVYDWEVHFEKEGHADGSVRFDMSTFFQEPVFTD